MKRLNIDEIKMQFEIFEHQSTDNNKEILNYIIYLENELQEKEKHISLLKERDIKHVGKLTELFSNSNYLSEIIDVKWGQSVLIKLYEYFKKLETKVPEDTKIGKDIGKEIK